MSIERMNPKYRDLPNVLPQLAHPELPALTNSNKGIMRINWKAIRPPDRVRRDFVY